MAAENGPPPPHALGVLKWMTKAPAERMTLPGAVLVLAAADLMHAEQVPPIDSAFGALAVATVCAFGVKNRRHGRQAAAAVAVAGGWLAWGVQAGPLSGPDHPLTWVWGGLSLAGYLALRNHEAIRARRELRRARHTWREYTASAYGLDGSHLLDFARTRLGEAYDVDVRDTGRRASHLANGDLAELIAERERLPVTRVRVRAAGIAGRLRISIRRIDPWATSPLHPVLDPNSEIQLAVPCTIREPACIGQDPETGAPLLLPLWEKSGTKNVMVIGMKGAGKSVLLNNLRERITAADDAIVWDINVSKAHEDIDWLDACDLAAVTSAERKRAAEILHMVRGIIQYRGAQPRDTANFVPTAADPLLVLIIDEIDALLEGNDRLTYQIKADLKYVASKNRSEGVALVLAGQRATADWIGGNDVRTQIDRVCIGKVSRQSEVRHAAGEIGLTLPDMATYGEGAEGVWLITDISGNFTIGRTFDLEAPADLRQLAGDRADSQPSLPTGLVVYLGETYARLKASRGTAASTPLPHAPGTAAAGGDSLPPDAPGASAVAVLDGPDPDPFTAMTEGLDFDMPDDLTRQLADLDTKLGKTRDIQADIGRMELPEVDPAKLADAISQRWAEAARNAKVNPVKLQFLVAFLGEGTTIRDASQRLGETQWTVRCWLELLRGEGIAKVEGKGRGSRWVLGRTDKNEGPETSEQQ